MRTGRRVARPGDVCVLLEPDEGELLSVRRLQTSLQALIGGRPHQRIHLTCQRFSVEDDHCLASVVDQLHLRVAPLPPVAVTVAGFVVLESPFWQTRLLRWQVEVTDDLRRLITAVEAGLAAAGVTPHFPSAAGAPATPPQITLLEDVPAMDCRLRSQTFPASPFVVRRVVLSRIVDRGRFEIVSGIGLVGGVEG